MINSIYSSTNYYGLQANNSLYRQQNANAEEDLLFTQNLLTDQTDGISDTSGTSYLPLEDHLGMMQRHQKPPAVPTGSEDEETLPEHESTTSDFLYRIDADGDGTISADEYEELVEKLGITNAPEADDFFAQYDTDGDGEITAAEMEAVKPGEVPPPGRPIEEVPAFSSSIDTDGDGSISADEYDTYISKSGITDALTSDDFFAKYDTDSDGELTADEISTAYNKYIRAAANAAGSYEASFDYVYDPESTAYSFTV